MDYVKGEYYDMKKKINEIEEYDHYVEDEGVGCAIALMIAISLVFIFALLIGLAFILISILVS